MRDASFALEDVGSSSSSKGFGALAFALPLKGFAGSEANGFEGLFVGLDSSSSKGLLTLLADGFGAPELSRAVAGGPPDRVWDARGFVWILTSANGFSEVRLEVFFVAMTAGVELEAEGTVAARVTAGVDEGLDCTVLEGFDGGID